MRAGKSAEIRLPFFRLRTVCSSGGPPPVICRTPVAGRRAASDRHRVASGKGPRELFTAM